MRFTLLALICLASNFISNNLRADVPTDPLVIIQKIALSGKAKVTIAELGQITGENRDSTYYRLTANSGLYTVEYVQEFNHTGHHHNRIAIARLDGAQIFPSFDDLNQSLAPLGVSPISKPKRVAVTKDQQGNFLYEFFVTSSLSELDFEWDSKLASVSNIFNSAAAQYHPAEVNLKRVADLVCSIMNATNVWEAMSNLGKVKSNCQKSTINNSDFVTYEYTVTNTPFDISYRYELKNGSNDPYGLDLTIEGKGPELFKNRAAARAWMEKYFTVVWGADSNDMISGANGEKNITSDFTFKGSIQDDLKSLEIEWDSYDATRLSKFCN